MPGQNRVTSWVRPLVVVVIALVIGAFIIAVGPKFFGWGIAAAMLWAAMSLMPGMVQGQDGPWSTSKFQLFVWTGAIAYCVVIYGRYQLALPPAGMPPMLPSLPELPSWMWVALGLSGSTALGAKGITVGYLQTHRLQPSKTADASNLGWMGLICDDSGQPDISKIQMLFWTILSVIYVVADATVSLRHMVTANSASLPAFPELNTSLLVLTGLGQGVYLGNKLFDSERPLITGTDRAAVRPGDVIAIHGSGFGETFEGQQVELDGSPLSPEATPWSDSQIQFKVPSSLAGQPWPANGKVVAVTVVVRGVKSSNDSKLNVTP